MKKRPLVLILLLLLLLSLTPKDVTAVYGDESSESITSFSETLDDTLFYPDGNTLESDDSPTDGGQSLLEGGDSVGTCFLNATSDDNDDVDGLALNGDGYNGIGTGGGVVSEGIGQIRFHLVVTISEYAEGGGSEMYINLEATSAISGGGSTNNFAQEDINANGEIIVEGICGLSTVGSIWVWANFTGASIGDTVVITCDSYYFYTMTLSENGYADGFMDVSDWTFDSESAGLPARSFTSDGDVLNFSISYDDTGNEWAKYDIDVSAFSGFQYLEIRYKTSATVGNSKSTRLTVTLDGAEILSSYSADWNTWKGNVVDDISEPYTTLELMADDYANTHASGYGYVLIDYLRISPANESGWQHDGSTIQGTESYVAGKVTAESSNGVLKISNTDNGAPQALAFWIDETSSTSTIETDYYQFLEVQVTALQAGAEWSLSLYDNTTQTSIQSVTSATGTFRYNIKAGYSSDPNRILFFVGGVISHAKWIDVTSLKVYSIANFTVGGNSLTINSIAYVDSGTLIVNPDSASDLSFYHDPALAVSTASFQVWNITANNLNPSGANDFNFKAYIDGLESHVDETRGTWTNSGTVTDFELKCYTDYEFRISALKFIDTHDWQEINDVEIIFQVGWTPEFQFSYDAFFIFLGLIMIPASTMYLAWGGRKAMSTDKLFYGLVLLALGFGFLIGGILP